MVLRFQSQYPIKRDPDIEKLDKLIEDLTKEDIDNHILLIAKNPEPCGLIAGVTSEIIFSRDKIASELMWWVDEEHRRSKVGMALLQAFELWASRIGCNMVQMVSVETEIAEALERVYTSNGYKVTEKAFIKEI